MEKAVKRPNEITPSQGTDIEDFASHGRMFVSPHTLKRYGRGCALCTHHCLAGAVGPAFVPVTLLTQELKSPAPDSCAPAQTS